MGVIGLKQFLSDPSAYNRSPSNRSVTSDFNLIIALNLICHFCLWSKHLVKNSNFFDMGYSNTITNQKKINNIIDEIMNMYSLVMITEYMEESLILMAHAFNWNLDDIRFFSVNKNADSEEERDNDLAAKVNAWSSADVALYARANQTLWRKVEEYGIDRMSVVKEELMRRNQALFDYCVDEIVTIKRTDIMKKARLATLKPDDPRFVFCPWKQQ